MSLLIVEDNDRMRRMIRSLVADIADPIYECEDGTEALDAYTVLRPDWVLMDLQMQRLGGLEATRRIRAAWPEARILIVTDYDDQDCRAAARQAGACGYLLKDDLLEVRRRLLQTQDWNQPPTIDCHGQRKDPSDATQAKTKPSVGHE
jgi:CheY-like chemotaxis protein